MKTYAEQLQDIARTNAGRTLQHRQGSTTWKSPSNIAIVKYWGKYPGQIPANASISVTLNNAFSETTVEYSLESGAAEPAVAFSFEGKSNEAFGARIGKYIHSITQYLPWLKQAHLKIDSKNTFPHSSGIASSASAMSALAAALCEIDRRIYGEESDAEQVRKASFLARLGSGSASRSLYPHMAIWGKTAAWESGSDEFAVPVPEMHEAFKGMKDSILIIEAGRKAVSSSLGHDLMKSNPYAKLRFEAAETNMQLLHKVIREGDLMEFIDIMENEALSLHAMMLTSKPGFILMKPNTMVAIERIRAHRLKTGDPIGFTLDAGANCHVMYPESHASALHQFVESELKPLCEGKRVIHDEMGMGAEMIK